ncbi:MAG: hypothetical protein Q9213_001099 [Squamulea squamosa]
MSTKPAALVRDVFQPAQDGSVVDKAKNALGMSSEAQSGTEPVNGETGDGTVGQPYDQGNKEGQSGTASNEFGGEGIGGIKGGNTNASGS